MTRRGAGAGSAGIRESRDYVDAAKALRDGDLATARTLGDRLSSKHPESAAANSLAAAIASAAGDYRSSLLHIEAAERLDPRDTGILAHKANTLAVIRRYAEAIACADRAMSLEPDHCDVLATLGTVYTKCGEYGRSLRCFREAAEQSPDDPVHQYNLGTALRFAGDFEGAETCFDRTLSLRPGDFETYYARSGLRTQTPERNHVDELERALASGTLPWRGETLLCYAIAKELEDIGDLERSFTYLRRGADLRRANMQYDVDRDVGKMKKIAAVHNRKFLTAGDPGYSSEAPVFIVGLPRAGSSLIERILVSHSRVMSAGELQNFAVELLRPIHARRGTTRIPFDRLVTETLGLEFRALGRAYLESTRHLTAGSPLFADKMPLNFLYVGLIHRALPDSKIIHVHRNPMDACYAMYKTVFKGAYPFSYDLQDIGRYYVAYYQLMQHWNDCLPGRILNLTYEDVIADQAATTRALLNHCGLDWEDACLSFHDLPTAATTASAVEVRRPIYSTSVGKWQNYRSQLSGLESYLRRHGINT